MRGETPESYRIGWVPFLGVEIWLDSWPLIPRVETEWWVEQLIDKLKTEDTLSAGERGPDPSGSRLLDLCAGSGAIGCAVLKALPNIRVSFGEIDSAHEATIRKNIEKNALDASRADIRIGDLFTPFVGERFDFIAANPPYVPSGRELPASVADYEPALALRAGEDGLAVIKRIVSELDRHLTPGGQAWIECDSEHAEEARGCFEATGFAASILNDQYDRPRVIVVSYLR